MMRMSCHKHTDKFVDFVAEVLLFIRLSLRLDAPDDLTTGSSVAWITVSVNI